MHHSLRWSSCDFGEEDPSHQNQVQLHQPFLADRDRLPSRNLQDVRPEQFPVGILQWASRGTLTVLKQVKGAKIYIRNKIRGFPLNSQWILFVPYTSRLRFQFYCTSSCIRTIFYDLRFFTMKFSNVDIHVVQLILNVTWKSRIDVRLLKLLLTRRTLLSRSCRFECGVSVSNS
jgi:hypothetical protein